LVGCVCAFVWVLFSRAVIVELLAAANCENDGISSWSIRNGAYGLLLLGDFKSLFKK